MTDRVAAGAEVLASLDAAKVPVDFAVWSLDEGKWTFSIHTPLLEVEGRTQAYKKIQTALKGKRTALKVDSIVLVPKTHSLVRALAGTFEVSGTGGISLSDSMINGVFIDEVILLRANMAGPPPTPSWFKPSWVDE